MSTSLPSPSEAAVAPAPRNGRGLVALILGVVAVLLAVAPFTSYGAWLLGIAAVVVGILAVVRPGLPKRAGVAGIVLGAIAVILSVVASILYTVLLLISSSSGAFHGYASQSPGAAVGDGGAVHTVVYSIRGKHRATAIAYYTVSGGQSGQTTLQDQALPWSKTVTVRGALDSASSVLTVIGQNGGSGRIRCTITLDGKVVSTQTGEGKGSTAQCIYRPAG